MKPSVIITAAAAIATAIGVTGCSLFSCSKTDADRAAIRAAAASAFAAALPLAAEKGEEYVKAELAKKVADGTLTQTQADQLLAAAGKLRDAAAAKLAADSAAPAAAVPSSSASSDSSASSEVK